MKKNLIFLIAFIVIGFIGYSVGKTTTTQPSTLTPSPAQIYGSAKAIREGENNLINPLLEYEVSQDIFAGELKNFKSSVQAVIDTNIHQGTLQDAAVYFRDLQDGPWFSINGNKNFAPASLLKLPIMIVYYMKAETDPTILTTKITYDNSYPFDDQNTSLYYQPEKQIEKGHIYTVDELITYMILYSDNNAKNLLQLNLSAADEGKVYTDLELADIIQVQNPQEDILSVISYSTFFRVLYNASYLNKEMSEKALMLLAKASFSKGIAQGIPTTITIAHKFGERTLDANKQLHDCGIVYYPTNPYLVCIMTRGTDFNQLSSVLSQISAAIYKAVDTQVKATHK